MNAIISEVLFKLGRLIVNKAMGLIISWWNRHEEEERVETKAEAVKEARKNLMKALKSCEEESEECPPTTEKERKLREASRRLLDELYTTGMR